MSTTATGRRRVRAPPFLGFFTDVAGFAAYPRRPVHGAGLGLTVGVEPTTFFVPPKLSILLYRLILWRRRRVPPTNAPCSLAAATLALILGARRLCITRLVIPANSPNAVACLASESAISLNNTGTGLKSTVGIFSVSPI